MGYGASVTAPMVIPKDPVDVYLRGDMPPVANPKVQTIKPLQSANAESIKATSRAMPPMANVDDLRRGRAEEAAEYAFAMKNAFAITKQYQRVNKRAAEKTAAADQKQAKNMGKYGGRRGTAFTSRNRAVAKSSAWRAAHRNDRHLLTHLR